MASASTIANKTYCLFAGPCGSSARVRPPLSPGRSSPVLPRLRPRPRPGGAARLARPCRAPLWRKPPPSPPSQGAKPRARAGWSPHRARQSLKWPNPGLGTRSRASRCHRLHEFVQLCPTEAFVRRARRRGFRAPVPRAQSRANCAPNLSRDESRGPTLRRRLVPADGRVSRPPSGARVLGVLGLAGGRAALRRLALSSSRRRPTSRRCPCCSSELLFCSADISRQETRSR
jgi:hypothetical protein